jgi:hypothetical protein
MSESPARSELPLADYDHIPLGTLPSRITSLNEGELETLLAYEREHGNRLPVTQVLEHRLEAVRGGAELAEGSAQSMPEMGQGQTGSRVSPATSGPPINPPSHGDPTNPAQPR